jgi:hypothetical protein
VCICIDIHNNNNNNNKKKKKKKKLYTKHKHCDTLHDKPDHPSGRRPHNRQNQKVFYVANIWPGAQERRLEAKTD